MRIMCKDLKSKCPKCGSPLMAINNVLMFCWTIDCKKCGEIKKRLSIKDIINYEKDNQEKNN
jgi:hypothetical protein